MYKLLPCAYLFVTRLRSINTPPLFNSAPFATPMCHTIQTRLTCGHIIYGPKIQCSEAASSYTPRAPPYDDSNGALCEPCSMVCPETTACCDDCVTGFTRQLLEAICRRCRRGVVHWMSQAVLNSLPSSSAAQHSRSGSEGSADTSSNNTSRSAAVVHAEKHSHR